MKRVSVIAAALFLCAAAFAKPVSRETARLVAENFWNTTDRGIATGETPDFTEISASLGLRGFYVFNTVENDGFVLVSSDDAMTPILGYSTANGMIGRTAMPANLKSWLTHYTDEYDAVVANGWGADELTAVEWNELVSGSYAPKNDGAKTVNALIQTQWDQDAPYNNLCPIQGGARSVTGCVATSMAQVMKYWEWPASGTGSHSYVSESYNLSVSANFAATTYDWANMPVGGLASDGYTSLAQSWNATQKTAVATLMFHCGVSVDMDYSSDESGAYSNYIPDALMTYFGYAPGARLRYKDDCTNSDWIALLKTELDATRPVLYGGESSQGGHSFVCDGYDANNKFHFNFGWSGVGDAFYALTSITPGSGGIGGGSYDFSDSQEAVIGISSPNGNPVDPASIPPDLATYENFTINTPVTYGSTITGECDFVNFGSTSFTGYMGVAAYLDDALVGILVKSTRGTWNQYYGPDLEISCPATSPYGNGTYTAKAVYSYDGQNWYPLEMGYYAPISVTFTITGGPSLYTITVNSANTEMGTVSGGGSYAAGSQVSISATAKPGYRFAHWNDGNTQTPRTINVTNNATYTAYFEADGGGYNAIDEVAASTVFLPRDFK